MNPDTENFALRCKRCEKVPCVCGMQTANPIDDGFRRIRIKLDDRNQKLRTQDQAVRQPYKD